MSEEPTAEDFLALGADDNAADTSETDEGNAFPDVEEWVRRWLAPALAPQLTGDGRGLVFCPQWWAHKPVTIRLHALWTAWEQARRTQTLSTWWVSHADPHLRVLCDGENGPMRYCASDRHIPTPSLAVIAAPAEWLDHQNRVADPVWLDRCAHVGDAATR